MPVPCSNESCTSHVCRIARLAISLFPASIPASGGWASDAEFRVWWNRVGGAIRVPLRDAFYRRFDETFILDQGHALSAIFARVHERAARNAVNDLEENDIRRNRVLDFLDRRLGLARCRCCGQPKSYECGCWHCEACGEMHRIDVHRCQHCGLCPDHCNCDVCPHCNALRDEDGNDTCGCGSRGIESRHPALKFLGDEGHARFPRYAGVEIEFGYDPRKNTKLFNKIAKQWHLNVHGDGSIEFDSSKEVATAPSRGDALIENVTAVCEAIRSVGGKVNASCGLHVHVDVKDLTGAQVLNVVRLYSMVELALYSVVAPSRRGGHYSKAWGQAFEWDGVLDTRLGVQARADRLDCVLYGSIEYAKEIKRNRTKHDSRYHGLNLNAIPLYGTIEFRLHHGTINPTKILNWTSVCQAIVQFAAVHTEDELRRMRGTPFEILCKVAKFADLKRWLIERRDYFTARRAASHDLGEAPPPLPDAEDSEIHDRAENDD